jgi:hypothetical protein
VSSISRSSALVLPLCGEDFLYDLQGRAERAARRTPPLISHELARPGGRGDGGGARRGGREAPAGTLTATRLAPPPWYPTAPGGAPPERYPGHSPSPAGRRARPGDGHPLGAPVLSRAKITVKGARCARVADAMALRTTLDRDLPRIDPAPVGRMTRSGSFESIGTTAVGFVTHQPQPAPPARPTTSAASCTLIVPVKGDPQMSALAYLASAANTPLWVQVPTAFNNIIAATGLIIAGSWAYVRFARGRILHPACDLILEAKELQMPDNTQALKVMATIKNVGGVRLVFPLSSNQTITVFRADPIIWKIAFEYGEVLWSEGVCHECDMLTWEGAKKADVSLEPGERLERFMLIPIATDPCTAYRVSMRIEAHPKLMWRTRPSRAWETEIVFGVGERV